MVSKLIGSLLTIAGGAFYIVGSLVALLFGSFVAFLNAGFSYNELLAIIVFGFGAIAGALIIGGGLMLNSELASHRKAGGVLAIVMMLLGAVFTLGGLGIGFILTLAGGVFGLTYNQSRSDIALGYQNISSPAGIQPTPTSTAPGTAASSASRVGGLNFCIKCGSPLHKGAFFCGYCGAPVPQD